MFQFGYHLLSDTWCAPSVRRPTIAGASASMMVKRSLFVEAATQIHQPSSEAGSTLDSDIMPCVFKEKWLKNVKFNKWIARDKDCTRAYCTVCHRSVDLSTMGTSALRSHMKGIKHKELVALNKKCMPLVLPTVDNGQVDQGKQQTTQSNPESKSVPDSKPTGCSCKCCDHTCASDVSKTVTNYDLKVADVWWALNVVSSGYSYSSCNDTAFIMKHQFPDSRIAQQFTFQETKCMYTITHGLAPFCKKLLCTKVANEPYVLMFDESPNKYLQQKQMDILLRFWDGDRIKSRFLTSTFMGHGRADDLLAHITDCVQGLPLGLQRVIQLSMDGPNVNFALYEKLNVLLQEQHNKEILNIGSCGLHTLHNGFKSGVEASKWEVDVFLRSLYTLFDDSPARREDYENITSKAEGAGLFPAKWCSHRWLENQTVAERALDMLPALKCYIAAIERGSVKDPGTKTFGIVKSFCRDYLGEAKLACFISIARLVEPFLKLYQTDKVMIPYLCQDLENVLKKIMRRYLKIDGNESGLKLLAVNIDSAEKQLDASEIEVGYVAQEKIKALVHKNKISDRAVKEFRLQARAFLNAIVAKMFNKCPIKYKLVRAIACLNPTLFSQKSELAVPKFKRVLQCLVAAKRVKLDHVDQLADDFSEWIRTADHEFASFDKSVGSLDSLYHNHFPKEEYPLLWGVVRELLLLSHGQAAVERGFSLGKSLSRENQLPETIICQKLVKDFVISSGGLQHIVVTKEMVAFASGAHRRYQDDLERKRQESAKKKGREKRKCVDEEIEKLAKKRKVLQEAIRNLNDKSLGLYEIAEETGQMKHVVSANAIRKGAGQKQDELKSLDIEIEHKRQMLNSIM